VNKTELVEEVAAATKLPPKDVAKVVEGMIASVVRSVTRGEKVVLSGFGTFHRRSRARRTARDIWADQPLAVPATNVPAFRPGRPFREVVARRRGAPHRADVSRKRARPQPVIARGRRGRRTTTKRRA
jgi:DNA-binding protein HU-beta